eukprot:2187357-Amphidinium_carterae.1
MTTKAHVHPLLWGCRVPSSPKKTFKGIREGLSCAAAAIAPTPQSAARLKLQLSVSRSGQPHQAAICDLKGS